VAICVRQNFSRINFDRGTPGLRLSFVLGALEFINLGEHPIDVYYYALKLVGFEFHHYRAGVQWSRVRSLCTSRQDQADIRRIPLGHLDTNSRLANVAANASRLCAGTENTNALGKLSCGYRDNVINALDDVLHLDRFVDTKKALPGGGRGFQGTRIRRLLP
jgi:hypothetical protein